MSVTRKLKKPKRSFRGLLMNSSVKAPAITSVTIYNMRALLLAVLLASPGPATSHGVGPATASLVAMTSSTYWATHGNAIAAASTLCGMGAGAVFCVSQPTEALRLGLSILAPMLTHIERSRSDYAGRLSTSVSYKGWELPSLATLSESCVLLEVTAREELFLCRQQEANAMMSEGCSFHLDLSNHYGEPVYVCARSV